MKVRVAFTVEVDLDAYEVNYGLERSKSAADARNYVNDIARSATGEALRLLDWGKVAD